MSIYDKEREALGLKKLGTSGVSDKPKKSIYDEEREALGLKKPSSQNKPQPTKTTPEINLNQLAQNREDSLQKQFGPFIKKAQTDGPMLTQGQTQSSFKDKALQFGKGLANPFITAANTIMDKSLKSKDPFFQSQYEADKKRTEEKLRPKTTGEKVAAGAGELVGTLAPVGAAYATGGKLALKAGSKAAPNLLAKPLVKQAVRGAGAGLVYGAGKGIGEGQDLKGIAKEAGENALMFGVADPALSLVGQGAKKLVVEPLAKRLNLLKEPIMPNAVGSSGVSGRDIGALNPQTDFSVDAFGNAFKGEPRPIAGLLPAPKAEPLKPKLPQYKPIDVEAKAMQELQEGIETAQNFIRHKDILAPYPPGTTYEQAFADIKAKTGVDIQQLVANLEKAQVPFKDVLGAKAERARLGRVAGVYPNPRLKPEIKPLEPNYSQAIGTREGLARPIKLQGQPFPKLEPTKPKLGEASLPKATPLEMLDEVNKAYARGKGLEPQPIGIKPKQIKPEPIKPEPIRPITTPKTGSPVGKKGKKELSFAQTVIDSQVATNEIKQGLKQNKPSYEPITNKETFEKATDFVNTDPERAIEAFNTTTKGVNADDVAIGEALIVKAIKNGNTNEANRIIADLAEKLMTAGQAVQAASVFKKYSPEGMLFYAQRVINRANKEAIQEMGKKAQKLVLTADDSDFIIKTMQEAQSLPDGRQKDIAIAKVMQFIANKVPANLSEKVQGIQRITLLLNPKTMTRNLVGNTLFGAVDNISNVVATPIDMLTSKFTGKRTTTLPSLPGQLKSGLKGVKETIEDARLGIDTYSGKTQFELPSKRIFETDTLDTLDKATRIGLQLGDRPFYQAAYDDVLRQQMKLAKVSEPTQEMIEQAHAIAQQRTYQDTNALTQAFRAAQKALNKASSAIGVGDENFGLGNIVLPFVKTPANILKRAIEYSPLGLQKALKEATKKGTGTFDQKAFVDALSRSITGTGLIMAGYELAKRGIITGSGNKDKDVASFERNLGKSDFAFKYGDNYYTYDWAQPASMALAIGADMHIKGKDRKEAENVVIEAVKSGGETLFKQSLLQGLQRFMGGYNPVENIETTVINAPTQLVPTFSKQVAQYTDPLQRSTYSTTKGGNTLKAIQSKLPVFSKSLEPKLDTFGKELKNYQGKNNLFNVFFNPGAATKFKPNKVQKEIIRLYETTGDKDIFPKVAPKNFTVKGEKFKLTPKEFTTFQRTMGKKTEEGMSRSVDSRMSDEAKAKVLKKIIEQSYEKAKLELLKNRGKK